MNLIKLSGIVNEVECFEDDCFTRIILAIPIKIKSLNKKEIKQRYTYISFLVFTNDYELYDEVEVGDYFEITGELMRNSYESESHGDALLIYPKSVRGGLKNVMGK